jgi:hypothetical protein
LRHFKDKLNKVWQAQHKGQGTSGKAKLLILSSPKVYANNHGMPFKIMPDSIG